MKKILTIIALLFTLVIGLDIGLSLYHNSVSNNFANINEANTSGNYLTLKFHKKIIFKNNSAHLYFVSGGYYMNVPIESKISKETIIIKVPYLLNGDYLLEAAGVEFKFYHTFSINKVVEGKAECLALGKNLKMIDCLNKYFWAKTVKTKDTKKILLELASATQNNPYLLENCHTFAHSIGQAAASYEKSFYSAFNKGDYTCQYGYYHGIMEGFADRLSDKVLAGTILNFCDYYKFGFNKGSCYHALGHMTWFRSGGNFLTANKICKTLGNDQNSLLSPEAACAAGVAMDWGLSYSTVSKKIQKTMEINSNRPTDKCNTLSPDLVMEGGCYAFIGIVYANQVNKISKFAYDCQKLSAYLSDRCWLNVGFMLGFTPGITFQDGVTLCSKAKRVEGMWYCFGNLIDNTTLKNSAGGFADKVCSMAKKIGRENKKQCNIMHSEEKLRLSTINPLEHIHTKP